MSIKTTTLSRVSMFTGAVLLLGTSVTLTILGFTILREDATDLCHIFGKAFNFSPDTRWFGLAVIAIVGSAYLFAKTFNKQMGQILAILVALWGAVIIAVPHLFIW